jgi:protein phosphatase
VATNTFSVGQATSRGRKYEQKGEKNEDSISVYEPKDPGQLAQRGILYLVADGMGGNEAGAVASDFAVRQITQRYYYTGLDLTPREALRKAIQGANAELFKLTTSKPEWSSMGTTIVAAVVVNGRDLYVANVGDSRAYLIRGSGVEQVSHDHTWVAEQVAQGKLSPAEARQHPARHRLTRRLGKGPDVRVDLEQRTMGSEDVLLLCSDGLSDLVPPAKIAEVARGHPPQEAAEALVELANQIRGHDNISVVLVGPERPAAPVGGGRRLNPLVYAAVPVLVLALAGIAWAATRPGPDPTPPPQTIVAVRSPTPVEIPDTQLPEATASPVQDSTVSATHTTESASTGPTATNVPPTSTVAVVSTPEPTQTPDDAPTNAPPPTQAATEPVRQGATILVQITGIDQDAHWEYIGEMTLVFYLNNRVVDRRPLEAGQTQVKVDIMADMVKVEGNDRGDIPWKDYRLEGGERRPVVDGRALFEFSRIEPNEPAPPNTSVPHTETPVPHTETPVHESPIAGPTGLPE